MEVVAKTKNGLEARKLLSIQKEELELADGITVEGNDPSRWSIKEENKIEAKATQVELLRNRNQQIGLKFR